MVPLFQLDVASVSHESRQKWIRFRTPIIVKWSEGIEAIGSKQALLAIVLSRIGCQSPCKALLYFPEARPMVRNNFRVARPPSRIVAKDERNFQLLAREDSINHSGCSLESCFFQLRGPVSHQAEVRGRFLGRDYVHKELFPIGRNIEAVKGSGNKPSSRTEGVA